MISTHNVLLKCEGHGIITERRFRYGQNGKHAVTYIWHEIHVIVQAIGTNNTCVDISIISIHIYIVCSPVLSYPVKRLTIRVLLDSSIGSAKTSPCSADKSYTFIMTVSKK